MKNTLFLSCCLAFAASAGEINFHLLSLNKESARKYQQDLKDAASKYRENLAEDIMKSDDIYLVRLDGNLMDDGAEDDFIITPYGKYAKPLETKKLSKSERENFAKLLSEELKSKSDKEGGAFCHEPDYGVYVVTKNEVIFSTSFSWKCRNMWVSYPDREINTEFLGSSLEHLKEYCDKVMPSKK